jgi:signal transduction histidine kinase
MSNLLSNAVKFTPAGGSITVSVQLQAHSGMVRLRVQDSGIGIPGRLLEQIFDPQAQTSRAGTNAERGTGFGMPLVKTYVENFGGYILLHSVEKDVDKSSHGTTADVFLPLAGKSPRYPRPVDNLQRPH